MTTRRDPWGLTPSERRTVVLYGLLGSCEEIAAVMDKRPGAVRAMLHRAREKMAVHNSAQCVLRLERWKRGWNVARCAKDVS